MVIMTFIYLYMAENVRITSGIEKSGHRNQTIGYKIFLVVMLMSAHIKSDFDEGLAMQLKLTYV